MSTTPARKTTKQAAAEVLRREGRPLSIEEIADGVLRSEGVRLTGKTPTATISAQLYVEAKKPNGLFELVGKGAFRLRELAERD
jgi:hypothetical protein